MKKEFDPADPIMNLEGVILDIKYGHADEVCIRTLQRVQGQIVEMEDKIALYEAHYQKIEAALKIEAVIKDKS